MNFATKQRTHYPALDGLRGLAIVLVVIYHNFAFVPVFNYGWLGVDLFFVLSGFLITDILMQTMDTKNYFRNFYARRILRIFPVYYLSLLLFLVLLPLFPSFPLNVRFYQQHQLWFWTYLQNWVLIFDYDNSTTVLNHFWSLAVEEQYYLVWPFVVILVKRPKRLVVVCLLVLVTVIIARLYIWQHRESFSTYQWLFLFTRIDGVLIGSMLALIYRINRAAIQKYSTLLILSLAGINFLVYFIDKDPNFPVWAIVGYATCSSLFALLVYESINGKNKIINFIFNNPILRFLGRYSYGLYIFHWPIYLLTKPYTDAWASDLPLTSGSTAWLVVSSLMATTAGLIVSVVSFHLFEKHFLRLKKYFA